jgi:RNA 2',3'-cyclic 3'-phosphodiesterase
MPRLFIAIRPPLPAIDALFDTMEAVENARWQDEEQLHITLAFLGDVPETAIDDLAVSLARVDFAPFDLTIAGTGHFERKGRIHALWAGIEPSPALLDLQRRVSEACERAGLTPERRRYHPHVTLARFSRPSPDIAAWLARHGTLRLSPFAVNRFGLYESHLSHDPAHYEELALFPAPGG